MSTVPSLPPGPKGLPFIGNYFDFQWQPLHFSRELQRNYGAVATVYFGKSLVLFVFRPEHIRYFLIENSRNFIKQTATGNTGVKLFLGDGLLTIDGDMHRQQRKLVQPAFHKHSVNKSADIITQFAQEMLNTWEYGKVVDIADEMQKLTLRIILKTLFDVDSLEQATRLGHAFDTVLSTGPIRRKIFARFINRQLLTKLSKDVSVIDAFVYDLIAQRRREEKDTGDILSLLLTTQEEDVALTDQQVHDHVLTFVAAGHDTVRNTLVWTFYLLSQNPQALEKLLAELHTILAGRLPTLEDLPNMPYLEWVINESWRFYPPVWALPPRLALNDFELDGYHIPAKTLIIISQWVMHNLPNIWGDPENFRPERWDPTNGQKVPQGAYFPFGLGPHICIGMSYAQLETKLLLTTILQRFTPHLAPSARVVLQPRTSLRPKYGMPMRLEPTSDQYC
jgi:cytochrome P450